MKTNEIMKRPICPVVWINNAGNLEYVHCDPECAWFDKDRNQCAVLTLAKRRNADDENESFVKS